MMSVVNGKDDPSSRLKSDTCKKKGMEGRTDWSTSGGSCDCNCLSTVQAQMLYLQREQDRNDVDLQLDRSDLCDPVGCL